MEKKRIAICPRCKRPATDSGDYFSAPYYIGMSTFKCSYCDYRGPPITLTIDEYKKLLEKEKKEG